MKIENLTLALMLLTIMYVEGCDSGLYSDANGICQQCEISCNTCASSDGCSSCYDQMFLMSQGNLIICDLCYNVNKGCDICLTATKCQNCSAGYYIEHDNTCSTCATAFPHCLLCQNGNAIECVSCQNPYQLVNGSCLIKGVPQTSNGTNAAQPASSSPQPTSNTPQPTTNSPQSSSSNGNNSPQTASNAPSNTQSGNSNLPTVQCDPSQIYINGICYPAIAFCEAYSQTNGSCTSCSSIFQLSNGYCLPSILILSHQKSNPSCSNRQYLSNGICVDIGTQCIQFDLSTGACYTCVSGFQAYKGLCVQQASETPTTSTPSISSPSTSAASTPAAPVTATINSSLTLPNCQIVNPLNAVECLQCVSGYTIVDALPGVCYKIN